MSLTHTSATHADDAEITVLSFSDEVDHCPYDPTAILAALTDTERQILIGVFGAQGLTDWETSTDLYCAVEELEELGHDAMASTLNGFIHAEQLYVCPCRAKAQDAFRAQVQDYLSRLEKRVPHGAWWAGPRVYEGGMDVDDLLTDLGWDESSVDELRFSLDPVGNGTVCQGDKALRIVAFETRELGSFAYRLDAGDVRAVRGAASPYATVENWVDLPEDVRVLMASLYYHDVSLAAGGLMRGISGRTHGYRGMDLPFDQLERLARTILAMPDPVPAAVSRLLPGMTLPLDDLIAALLAA